MTSHLFSLSVLAVTVTLTSMLSMHRYRRSLIALVAALSLATAAVIFCAGFLFRLPVERSVFGWVRAYGFLSIVLSALLVEIVARFMRSPGSARKGTAQQSGLGFLWAARALSVAALIEAAANQWALPGQSGLEQVFVVVPLGMVIGISLFVNSLAVLYVIESTYRFSAAYQRRIARLCFISIGLIAFFMVVFSVRILLYRTVTKAYIDAAAVVAGVCVPVLLLGLVRYRLGSEQISVSRHTVYSSVTLLMVGAVLLGLSGAIAVGKYLGVAPGTFEMYLVVFVVAFFGILTVSSGTMRIRVMEFINTHVYTLKYDYREQFFRLHRTYMSGSNLEGSVTELVENMKYAVAVDDAFVFLVGGQDGVFSMHQNQEVATPESLTVPGDHPFVTVMRNAKREIDFVARPEDAPEKAALACQHPDLARLLVRTYFPIRHQDELVGFLGIRQHTRTVFDKEDLDLIGVFTGSIGNVVFKQGMLRERIEHKQFESFTRVASFIIHDIKNQVATLSLLLRNADRNIGNPDFQKSLITSVKDTSNNLQQLIDRLSASRDMKPTAPEPDLVDNIVREAIESTVISVLDSVTLNLALAAPPNSRADKGTLFYVVKNLVFNALEAMDNRGALKVESGLAQQLPELVAVRCGIGTHVTQNRTTYILVSDTGRGMSSDYVKNRLFHPFSSTKDKGVGIGLYQCKTLVEKDGGLIRCFSEPGKGTTFCILI